MYSWDLCRNFNTFRKQPVNVLSSFQVCYGNHFSLIICSRSYGFHYLIQFCCIFEHTFLDWILWRHPFLCLHPSCFQTHFPMLWRFAAAKQKLYFLLILSRSNILRPNSEFKCTSAAHIPRMKIQTLCDHLDHTWFLKISTRLVWRQITKSDHQRKRNHGEML